jgi:hypothetical protein
MTKLANPAGGEELASKAELPNRATGAKLANQTGKEAI